ncbi:ubiquitin-conjugating enzyme E2 T-like isoform X1 [Huso huso]|uniref:Ubiquitin-conjugating enzyme E2 T-like isoform X1 n=1 Tax=Huso huso TaxID=61971 RepID=A0ABR0YCJ2_HUSHU
MNCQRDYRSQCSPRTRRARGQTLEYSEKKRESVGQVLNIKKFTADVLTVSPESMQRSSRLKRELQLLSTEPAPGISCWQNDGRVDDLRAQIVGGVSTPYEGGLFTLEIVLPERYPFEPPKMRFLTPIYHPNIDSAGRICLDALKLPPKGAWRPSLNISTVLTSIQLLMAEPNPDDPLMADISSEYKYNKPVYLEKARQWTEKHAIQRNQGLGDLDKSPCEDELSKGLAGPRKRGALDTGEEEEEVKKTCV